MGECRNWSGTLLAARSSEATGGVENKNHDVRDVAMRAAWQTAHFRAAVFNHSATPPVPGDAPP